MLPATQLDWMRARELLYLARDLAKINEEVSSFWVRPRRRVLRVLSHRRAPPPADTPLRVRAV